MKTRWFTACGSLDAPTVGRTLTEVRVAAGHTNLAVTSIYLHVAVDDDDGIGELFGAR
jgi:hypothetical protein